MVQQGSVLVAAAVAWHRVQRAFAAGRSLLRAQDPCLASRVWGAPRSIHGLPPSRDGPVTCPNGGTTDCRRLKDVTSPLRACRGKTSLASCLRRKLKDSLPSPAE